MEEWGFGQALKARWDFRQSLGINYLRPQLVLLQDGVRNPGDSRGKLRSEFVPGALFPQLSRDHRLVAPGKDVSSRPLFGQHSAAGVCICMCKCGFDLIRVLSGLTLTPILLTCLVPEGI